ncbi:GNAT family N-acetyltransferase [Streptomyces sp. NBC_01237]|uniref:GNAT family N-acetyltransferase n=1 Tax=Streptomyces sp. NBC_01237 TaxID=2903790 RepID=UPI002DDC3358|nr:GNAT family N-acetyltransferase [Streptomyces sp. NBC_01237]
MKIEISPPLTDPELNALFAAAWPGHRPTEFGPVLARSLLWLAARRGGPSEERGDAPAAGQGNGRGEGPGNGRGEGEGDERGERKGAGRGEGSGGGRLVGYVNVVGDGGVHAFVLDTTVHPDERRRGLGRRLVTTAAEQARARGARWLHVDYEPALAGFYAGCGFRPTAAGLMALD